MSKSNIENNRKIMQEYLEYLEDVDRSPKTIVCLKSSVRQFIEWYEAETKGASILKINTDHIAKYNANIKDAMYQPQSKLGMEAPKRAYGELSKNRLRSSTKGFLFWLYDKHKINTNLSTEIKTKRLKKKTLNRELLTYQEVQILMDKGCQNSRDRAIVATLIDSGLRRSEILNLLYNDVKIERGGVAIYVRSERENDKIEPRRVFCIWCAPEIMRWKQDHPVKTRDSHFFCSLQSPYGKLSPEAIWEQLRKITRRAGLDKRVHPHLFRHSSVTWYAASGDHKNTFELRERYGWSKYSTQPDTYISFAGSEFDNEVKKRHGVPITETEVDGMKMITCPTCRLLQHAEVPRCTNCGAALSPEEIERDRAIQAAEDARKADEIAERVLSKLEGSVPISAIKKMMREDSSDGVIHFDMNLLKKEEKK